MTVSDAIAKTKKLLGSLRELPENADILSMRISDCECRDGIHLFDGEELFDPATVEEEEGSDEFAPCFHVNIGGTDVFWYRDRQGG